MLIFFSVEMTLRIHDGGGVVLVTYLLLILPSAGKDVSEQLLTGINSESL